MISLEKAAALIPPLPDNYRERIARHEAFWRGELTDGPLLHVCTPRKNVAIQYPPDKRKWEDADYFALSALQRCAATEFLADAIPSVFPDIGPDFLSACFLGRLRFVETTSHLTPTLEKWEDLNQLKFDPTNVYFRKMLEYYEKLLPYAGEKFLVNLPDFHGNADCLAAWRGPENLCMDLFDNPQMVHDGLKFVGREFKKIFHYFYELLATRHLPCHAWINLCAERAYGIPSCDFSYMIGTDHFEEFLAAPISEECRMCDYNIFHVDGEGVLKHLDRILSFPNVQVIQWVPGANHGTAKDWIEVYQRCYRAGKSVQIAITYDDLEAVFKHLIPERTMLLYYASTREEADCVIKRIKRWQ